MVIIEQDNVWGEQFSICVLVPEHIIRVCVCVCERAYSGVFARNSNCEETCKHCFGRMTTAVWLFNFLFPTAMRQGSTDTHELQLSRVQPWKYTSAEPALPRVSQPHHQTPTLSTPWGSKSEKWKFRKVMTSWFLSKGSAEMWYLSFYMCLFLELKQICVPYVQNVMSGSFILHIVTCFVSFYPCSSSLYANKQSQGSTLKADLQATNFTIEEVKQQRRYPREMSGLLS